MNRKTILIFSISYIICDILFLSSCKNTTIDISQIVAERDSLRSINTIQQQELENLNTCIFTISNSLDSIREQEQIIKLNTGDGKKINRSILKQSFEELAQLISRQRARISVLEDSLKQKSSKAPELQKMIVFLNEQLELKEKEIELLKAQVSSQKQDIKRMNDYIASADKKMTELSQKNEAQEQIITTQSKMINTGYIKIGTKKQLKEAGIITTGILTTAKINTSNLTPEVCQSVDIRDITEISLNSKNPKILSQMPPHSYYLQKSSDGKSCTLFIVDSALFWSQSFYLVILL